MLVDVEVVAKSLHFAEVIAVVVRRSPPLCGMNRSCIPAPALQVGHQATGENCFIAAKQKSHNEGNGKFVGKGSAMKSLSMYPR